jgi:hypothetical protein
VEQSRLEYTGDFLRLLFGRIVQHAILFFFAFVDYGDKSAKYVVLEVGIAQEAFLDALMLIGSRRRIQIFLRRPVNRAKRLTSDSFNSSGMAYLKPFLKLSALNSSYYLKRILR